MKRLLRLLLLWLLLLALPFQGFAAAAMLPCAGMAGMAGVSAPAAHHHAAMMDQRVAMPHAQAGMAHAPASATVVHTTPVVDLGHHGHDHGHSSIKCGGSACCAGTAPAPAMAPLLPALPAGSAAISLATPFPPTVDLAHPERPPQRA